MDAAAKKAEESMNRVFNATESGVNKSVGSLNDFADKAGEAGNKAGNSFGAGLTLALAAASTEFLLKVEETIGKAAEFASGLQTLSFITGDNTTKLQEFQYAMERVGVSTEQSQRQLMQFQLRIENAAAKAKDTSSSFYRMGLDAKAMVGRDVITNFEAVAQKIAQMKNSTDQTAAAMQTFGALLGARLLPLLREGKTGISDLMGAASGMGAVIPADLIDKLAALDASMKSLAQSSQAFFATMAGPIIPALTNLADALSRFLGMIENLDPMQRMLIMLGALGVAFISFAQGIQLVSSSFLGNFIKREVLDWLIDFTGLLRIAALTVTAVAAAWITDFAGIREAFQPVINGAIIAFQQLQQTLTFVGHVIREDIAPAWDRLGAAISPVLATWGRTIGSMLSNEGMWKTIREDIEALAKALGGLIDFIAAHYTTIRDLAEAFLFLKAVLIGGEIIAALDGIRLALIAQAAWWITVAQEGIATFIAMLGEGFVAACSQAVIAMFGVQVAADAMYAAMTLGLSLLVTALVAGIFYVRTHWEESINAMKALWDALVSVVEFAVSAIERALSRLLEGLSKVLDFFGNTTDAALAHAAAMDLDAAATDKNADAQMRLARARQEGSGKTPPGPGTAMDRYGAPGQWYENLVHGKQGPTGPAKTGEYEPPAAKTKAGPDTARELIKAMNLEIDAFKEKVARADDAAKMLATDVTELGKQSDTWGRLRMQMTLLHAEAAASIVAFNAQRNLVTDLVSVHDRLAKAMAGTHDTKKLDEYRTEMHTINDEIEAGTVKLHDLQFKHNDLIRDATKLENDHAVAIAKSAEEARKLALAYQTEALKHNIAMRDLTVISGAPGQVADREQARKVADAKDQERIAALALTEAQKEEWQASINATNAARVFGANSLEAAAALNLATQATNNVQMALNQLHAAQKTLRNIENESSNTVLKTRDAFASLIDSALGPFSAVVKNIRDGMNPMAALFVELFRKSGAFKDIVEVLTNIFDRLAQVIDAFRPVIDLLLGALIGIVNVFLMLYNVVATILGVLGIHIQKIQQLNAALEGTISSVPLLQVTHDLPTANEYNQGNWQSLIAKTQTTNDTLNTNFSQGMARIGQVIGILIGISLLNTALHALSLININLKIQHINLHAITNTLLMQMNSHMAMMAAGGGAGGGGLLGFLGKALPWVGAAAAVFSLFGHHGASAPPTTPVNTGPAATPSLADMFSHATSLNLAQAFGVANVNGQSGLTTTPGGGAPGSPGSAASSGLVVNIENLNGTDPATVKTMFDPIFDEWGRRQQIAQRTLASQFGRDSFA